MDSHLIESNYDLKVSDMRLLEEHFGTEIYLIEAGAQKYIVKAMPLYFENVENEGFITEYLSGRSHKVARLIKSRDGS